MNTFTIIYLKLCLYLWFPASFIHISHTPFNILHCCCCCVKYNSILRLIICSAMKYKALNSVSHVGDFFCTRQSLFPYICMFHSASLVFCLCIRKLGRSALPRRFSRRLDRYLQQHETKQFIKQSTKRRLLFNYKTIVASAADEAANIWWWRWMHLINYILH